MKSITKKLALGLAGIVAVGMFAGCSAKDSAKEISVITRENGSGTRGAFVELLGIEEKTSDGKKVDHTTTEAITAPKTDIMLSNVAGDENAIGYVSLGSLNNTVKSLKVNGVEATAENIKNGKYEVARPFNIVTKGNAQGLAKDFIDFILSKEGQAVVVKNGFIAINDQAEVYKGTKPEGKIVISGSSSVTPVMEKLKEAYIAINSKAVIEVQQQDSTAGITGTVEGTCDIGMVSRDLKDSEKEKVNGIEIAIDGIAVIANTNNAVSDLTKDQIKSIFTGSITKWDEVSK